MTDRQVALYARVSSEHQAEANTIDSQVAEIRARIAADGVDLRFPVALEKFLAVRPPGDSHDLGASHFQMSLTV
jgi:hypothetical protein